MTDLRIWATLTIVGLIPFTLLGGWGPAGDTSFWPWIAGFGAQAAAVAAASLRLRLGPTWWQPWKRHGRRAAAG
jgi:hypothetical protein